MREKGVSKLRRGPKGKALNLSRVRVRRRCEGGRRTLAMPSGSVGLNVISVGGPISRFDAAEIAGAYRVLSSVAVTSERAGAARRSETRRGKGEQNLRNREFLTTGDVPTRLPFILEHLDLIVGGVIAAGCVAGFFYFIGR